MKNRGDDAFAPILPDSLGACLGGRRGERIAGGIGCPRRRSTLKLATATCWFWGYGVVLDARWAAMGWICPYLIESLSMFTGLVELRAVVDQLIPRRLEFGW